MFNLGVAPWELVARSIAIYLALFVGLRLFGKREVGQFTVFDLVFVLLVANAVQPAMTGPDSSLLGGIIIIAALILTNYGISLLDRLPFAHRLLIGQPTVIIQAGDYVRPALSREGVDVEEVDSAIREHGLESVTDVKLGVLEPDGSISIIPKDANVTQTKRRVRRRYRPGSR